MDWFLYDKDLRHERVKKMFVCTKSQDFLVINDWQHVV